MLYAILFASLIYVNSGQLLPECTQDSECSSLDSDPQIQGGLGLLGISGENFVCSTKLNSCTITCNNGQDSCDKSKSIVGVDTLACLDEGDGVMKCSVNEDRTCTTSADCVAKSIGAIWPRCDSNICVEQTPAPTDAPTTSEPTRVDATSAPTGTPVTKAPSTSPTTTAEGILACQAECDATDTVAYACEANINQDLSAFDPTATGTFELTIPCTDNANQCEAKCFADGTYASTVKDYTADVRSKIGLVVPDPVTSFCYEGTCADGPTTSDDVTYEECMEACESEPADAVKCEGYKEISSVPVEVPCTDLRNECEAECFVLLQKQSIVDQYGGLVSLDDINDAIDLAYAQDPDYDSLIDEFCVSGTCSDGNTASTMDPDEGDVTTTDISATRDCDDDEGAPLGNDCPDEDPFDGCQIQFNVTLDTCILNRKFTRPKVYRYAKLAYIYALETVASYFDCIEGDLRITRLLPGYADNNARNRAKRKPLRQRTDDDDESTCGGDNDPDNICCEDLDDICGSDRKSKKYTLELDTQFKCGACNDMKDAVVKIQSLLDAVDAAFILKCLDLSVDGLIDVGLEGDNICATGLGALAMEVTDASLAYINENGETEVEISTSNAYGIKYGLALISAFIMAAIY